MLLSPPSRSRRSFDLDAVALALLAAIALIMLVLVGLVRAEPLSKQSTPRTFYDSQGDHLWGTACWPVVHVGRQAHRNRSRASHQVSLERGPRRPKSSS